MKKIKILFFAIAMIFSVTSCLEEKPLEDDPVGKSESLLNMQTEFAKATNGLTPLSMKKNEWALFRYTARLYTGEYQGLGYKAAQVMDLGGDNDTENIDGQDYPIKKISTVVTNYLEPSPGEQPQEDPNNPQKEWNCKFVKPPYYLWLSNCELPPEQNYWLFHALQEPTTPIFFSLAKYTKREKLPQILVDEGRCYNFANCEIDVNYLEYDIIGKDTSGATRRLHYITAFSGELPYLASNIKTCYSTLYEIDGVKHPADICQTLVNFQPE